MGTETLEPDGSGLRFSSRFGIIGQDLGFLGLRLSSMLENRDLEYCDLSLYSGFPNRQCLGLLSGIIIVPPNKMTVRLNEMV